MSYQTGYMTNKPDYMSNRSKAGMLSAMDILSDILNTIKLDGSLYFRTVLSGQWGIKIPSYKNVARFHIVMNGQFFLKVPELDSEIEVNPGDMIIVPHGQTHLITSDSNGDVTELEDVIKQAEYKAGELLKFGDADGQATNLICGHFEFEELNIHPIIKSLPAVLHIRKEQSFNFAWINTALDFIDYEAVNRDPGAASIIKRLSEITFVQAMRVYMKENTENSVFLAGISDRYIRKSIDKIHADPGRKWKLEELAKISGLSRTIYTERFKKLTGLTPLKYTTMWRVEIAKSLLKDKTRSIGQIANEVGFVAEEHFQKTFKKLVGSTPSHFRKSINH